MNEFCEQVLSCAENLLLASAQRTSRRLRVAGRSVELCGPNREYLDRLQRAFAHLIEPEEPESASLPQAPALRVILWDSRTTGIPMKESPWRPEDFSERERLRGRSPDGRWRMAYDAGRGTLYVLDCERRLGMCWTNNLAAVPEYDMAAPMLQLWTWWLRSIDMRLVHGAVVGFADGGVLITARGGSGKSTTAMNCLASELFFVADDYCIVSGGPEPKAYSLLATGKLRKAAILRLPHLEGMQSHRMPEVGARDPKHIYYLHPFWANKLIEQVPLRAIMVPNVHAGSETSVESISPSMALRALAPSTLFQLGTHGNEDLHFFANLVRTLPSYTLHLGSDLSVIPPTIAAFLHDLGAGKSASV